MQKILIVDDEPDILELLKYNLEREDYWVKTAGDGTEAIALAKEFLPHLILLDIMMPKLDGIETCRLLRNIPSLKQSFILFLTSRSEEYSEIAAFEVGANDFITKPIKPRALMSRISALFKRETVQINASHPIEVRELLIDKESYTLYKNKQKIALPRKEFELLYFLMKHPKVLFNREDLLRNIWGVDVYVVPRTVDVHIRKLREKIGNQYIKTVKGIGYKFDAET